LNFEKRHKVAAICKQGKVPICWRNPKLLPLAHDENKNKIRSFLLFSFHRIGLIQIKGWRILVYELSG
jgi:hypothetical protein